MVRHLCGPLTWLILASLAHAQPDRAGQAPPAAVALFEDDAEFLKEHLHNQGVPDASVIDRNEDTVYSGTCSVTVSEFQKFNAQLPGWNYRIAEKPEPGQYRFLRFAWKRTEAPGIMIQIHARPGSWHRYYAGTVTKQTQSWGAMTRVSEEAPRQWELVTRDLFQDFGPMTITGIGLSALDGPGYAYFDHIYLGRTIEDLDRVTQALKKVSDPPIAAAAPWSGDAARWVLPAVAVAGMIAAAIVCLMKWRRSAQPQGAAAAAGALPDAGEAAQAKDGSMLEFACTACGKHLKVKSALAGQRVKCPACAHRMEAPARS